MATPKELVAVVSAQTGVPEATVVVHDRNLALARLRSPALRGRGTSRVSFADAANLLIAVAGSRNVKDSVKTVQEYTRLPADAKLEFDGGEARGATFGDAIATLLEIIPASRGDFSETDSVTVLISGPKPRATITIDVEGRHSKYIYEPRPTRNIRPPFADLEFIAKFTQVTLGHVGELVADHLPDANQKLTTCAR